MGEALSRSDWISRLAADLTKRQVKRGLTPAPDLAAAAGEELTAAVVSTQVAALHSQGHLLDEIVEQMERGRWLADRTDPAAVAFECLSAYRGGDYPGPAWWDAGLFCFSFLEWWIARVKAASGKSATEGALRERWLIDDPEVVESLCGRPAETGSPPAEVLEGLGSSSPLVEQLLASEQVAEARDEALDALPEPIDSSAEIRDLVAALAVNRLLEGLVTELGDEDAGELIAAQEELEASIDSSLNGLALLERVLLEPPSAEAKTLLSAIEETRRRHLIVMLGSGHGMVNGIADQLSGETLVPDWLGDEVFGAGARSGTFSFGPSAYLWLGLEPHEVPPGGELRAVSLALLRENGRHPIELSFAIGRDEDAFHMPFGLGGSDETRRWLALLTASKLLLFDVFEIQPGGEMRLLQRGAISVENVASEIRARVVAELNQAGPAPLLTGNELEEHVIAGFAASENAKSELLLTLSADAGTDREEVQDARRALLDAHVSRAWTLYSHGDPSHDERRVEAATRAYAETRSWGPPRRHPVMTMDFPAAHCELVGPFTGDTRAVVHFNFSSGHIEGLWTARGGEERGWIPFESFDLLALIEAVEPWFLGKAGDLDRLISAAVPLAAGIHEALAGSGVSEIVIIPWAPLHGVPFAALPLGDKGTLGDRYRISYAPSLAVLRPLLAPPDPAKQSVELVAAHGSSLRWASAEIEAAHTFYPGANVTPDEAPRAEVIAALQRGRLVHLSSHGQWWPGDHFASYLDLRLPGPFDRRISAAEIHRDLDLTGTELLILSACDTGRSPSLQRGIESYDGLDAAFLARGARAVVSTLWPIHDLAATIFTTSLHANLHSNQDLPTAFASSVNLLRSGTIARLPPTDATAKALDAADPDWRPAADDAAPVLTSPQAWAAFRLSGVPWLVQP